jgi:predicted nucleotidyltransferase
MNLTPEQHIEALARLIAGHAGVRRVTLFGSRARGDAAPRSDIDLAVVLDPGAAFDPIAEAVETYPTLLRIDLVRVGPELGALGEEIARTGKVLHERA